MEGKKQMDPAIQENDRTGSIAVAEPSPWIAHVVPHTHWDREWYQPFETFRARLVDVVDEVLDLLDDPAARFPCFTLDGQAIVVEDFLDVRPQRRSAIERFVRQGRLRIGPWYVLADEYLVSPEALVRNLELGHAVSREFGGSMHVAYTPDSFGHIAQLPRLVAEFGHKAVVFQRGMGDEAERLGSEFEWRSPDGHVASLAVNLVGTYSSVTALGHLDWEYQDPYDPQRAVRQARSVLFGPDAGEPAFPEWLRTAIERIPDGITAYAKTRVLLLLNGSDHLFPQRNLPDVIDTLNERIDGVRFEHSDVETYVDDLRGRDPDLEIYQGEFRSSRYHHVLSGVWSTRMPLKQRNHASETLLERYAEPLLALAAVTAGHDDADLLRTAWRKLLENHPHDSICGCSIDDVERQMNARSDAVDQLGHALSERAVMALTAADEPPELVVFDPAPRAGWTLVEHTFDAPAGTGAEHRFQDVHGSRFPSQLTVRRVAVPGRSDTQVDRVTALFALPTEGLGLTAVRLRGSGTDRAQEAGAPATATDPVTVKTGDDGHVLANRAVSVHVSRDGSIVLEDRESGRRHDLRLWLEDERDAGDSYDFSPVPGDIPIRGWTHTPADVRQHGPLRGSVRLAGALEVPARLGEDRRPSEGMVVVPFHVDVSLDAFAERVDLKVALENQAHDHRLRLVVATGVHAGEIASDGHWHLVKRPVGPPAAEHWYQRPVSTVHQRRFSAVSDGTSGLSVMAKGLPEVEARPADDGVEIAVTLLRAVGWLSRDDLVSRPQGAGPALEAPGAQCPGSHVFELAIAPFEGGFAAPRLYAEAERFHTPARAFVAGHVDPRPDLKPGTEASTRESALRSDGSLHLTAPLALTALRPREDGTTEVRIYNPTPEPVSGTLALHPIPDRVDVARLDGTRRYDQPTEGGVVSLTLEPSEVTTLVCSYLRKGGDT